jgi:hypothetical protein
MYHVYECHSRDLSINVINEEKNENYVSVHNNNENYSSLHHNNVDDEHIFYYNYPTFCKTCGELSRSKCNNCVNCGYCVSPRGNGECVAGDEYGPYFREDCAYYEYQRPNKKVLYMPYLLFLDEYDYHDHHNSPNWKKWKIPRKWKKHHNKKYK